MIYAPDSGKGDAKMARFWNRCHALLPPDVDMVLGDFNLTLRPEDTTSSTPHALPKAALSSLLSTLSLTDPAHESAPHTFFGSHGGTEYSSRLDYMYVPLDSPLGPCLLPTQDPKLSDHCPVKWSVAASWAPRPSPVWKWSPSRLTPEALLATATLVDSLAQNPTVEEWDSFKRSIQAISRQFPAPPPPPPDGAISKERLEERFVQNAHTARISVDAARELPSRYLSSWAKAKKGATAFSLLRKSEQDPPTADPAAIMRLLEV